jgi:hypothetical protein
MSRKRKYFTEEELLEAQRRYNREYYNRNKKKMDKGARMRYHKNKQEKEDANL